MNVRAFATVVLPEAMALFEGATGLAPRSFSADDVSAKLPGVEWFRFHDLEMFDDVEVARRIGLIAQVDPREVLVVTEASLARLKGAFLLSGARLESLIRSHLSLFGECFFNGDVVVVGLASKRIWVFHHEGAYVCVTVQG